MPTDKKTTLSNWGFDMEQKTQAELNREKLRQHFLNLRPEEQVKGWDDIWSQDFTPWDRARPNPALIDAMKEKSHLLGTPFKDDDAEKKIRKKALVPGCGRGYDVLLFSSYGYDAYGLDGSPTAIEEAKKTLQAQGKEQHYPIQNIQDGRGEVKFILADFFHNDFLSQTGSSSSEGSFDLIYDYTFLCALPPSLRPKWAARMSELLAPGGRLVCLEFPLWKDPKLGGPAYGLEPELYEQLFAKPGSEVNYNLSGSVCEDQSGDKTDNALVRVDHWKPERVFEGQEKQSMVSIWRHWKS